MKKIIILLFITLLLSGCGICNLDNFITPDDTEFLALIKELDTPEKICAYMKDNFEPEAHPFYAVSPYELYKTKKGDCNDFSTFAIFCANHHGYTIYQIIITFINKINRHSIAVYKENKYSFSDYEIYCSARYNTFLEIVEYDCYLRDEIWEKYIVYDYDINIIEQVTK